MAEKNRAAQRPHLFEWSGCFAGRVPLLAWRIVVGFFPSNEGRGLSVPARSCIIFVVALLPFGCGILLSLPASSAF
jgi:hypothetical protein